MSIIKKGTPQDQEDLEIYSMEAGREKFEASLTNKHGKSTNASETGAGMSIISRGVQAMEGPLKVFLQNHNYSNKFQQTVLKSLPAVDLCFLTLRATLDACMHNLRAVYDGTRVSGTTPLPFSTVCINLGSVIVDHFNFFMFYKKNNQKLHEWLLKVIPSKSRAHRAKMMRWFRSLNEAGKIEVIKPDKAAIGYYLIKTAIEATGLIEITTQRVRNKEFSVVYPNPKLLQKMADIMNKQALAAPMLLPMVIPALPWTTFETGGYLSFRHMLVGVTPELNHLLDSQGFLENKKKCCDYLGSIPWEINRGLLQTAQEAYRLQHWSVPVSELNVDLPIKPWGDEEEYKAMLESQPEVVKEWKAKAAYIYAQAFGSRAVSRRVQFLRQLHIGNQMQEYESIYFPHRIDYRGRFYPIPPQVNPQADDFGKSLLLLKPLECQPEGYGWDMYRVYGAGLMGVDKCTFGERIKYIEENHRAIVEFISDPLAHNFWRDADKPWCFLAWATEYVAISEKGQRFTQVPVGLDGSCNGLQHLAAAMRDEVAGKLVNLLPSEEPQDIYTVVMNEVESSLPHDSEWKGKITRKLVKRNTMTTPYNVTKYGMRRQLEEEMKDSNGTGRIEREDLALVNELADYNEAAIDKCVDKPRRLMAWYSEVANHYLKRNMRPSWDLPCGFRVVQNLPQMVAKSIQLESHAVNLYYKVPIDKQDSRHNTAAFAPNVTHSMDACHMTNVILGVIDEGKNTPIVAIHDSFGFRYPEVRVNGEKTLEAFTKLYQNFDIVEELRSNYRLRTGGELPTPPECGTLDITKVKESIYAFCP